MKKAKFEIEFPEWELSILCILGCEEIGLIL